MYICGIGCWKILLEFMESEGQIRCPFKRTLSMNGVTITITVVRKQ